LRVLVDCSCTAFKDNLDLIHIHTHKGCNHNCGQKNDISILIQNQRDALISQIYLGIEL